MYDMIVINNLSFQSGGYLLLRSYFKLYLDFQIIWYWLLLVFNICYRPAVKEDDGLRVLCVWEFINILLRPDTLLVLISSPGS